MTFKTRWQTAYNKQPLPSDSHEGWRGFNGYRHPRTYDLLHQSLRLATAEWRGWRVLDAGCGSGDTGGFLTAQNEVIGGDFSHQMARAARRVYPHVTLADVERLPFPADSFDGLIASGVWQCLPPESAFPAEIARVLRPNGQAVLGWVLNQNYLLYRRGVHFRLDPEVTMTLYSPAEIRARLAAVGLRVVALYGALFPLRLIKNPPDISAALFPAYTVLAAKV